jgi:hypothetical protein
MRDPPRSTLRALLLTVCAVHCAYGFRVLDSSADPKASTPAVFQPYVKGGAGYYGDPLNPDPERVNEGAPFSPDTPRVYLFGSPKRECSIWLLVTGLCGLLTHKVTWMLTPQRTVRAWSALFRRKSTIAVAASTDTATVAVASVCAIKGTPVWIARTVSRPTSARAVSATQRVRGESNPTNATPPTKVSLLVSSCRELSERLFTRRDLQLRDGRVHLRAEPKRRRLHQTRVQLRPEVHELHDDGVPQLPRRLLRRTVDAEVRCVCSCLYGLIQCGLWYSRFSVFHLCSLVQNVRPAVPRV